MISGVAGRYASALFDLARDENAMDAIGAQLEQFDALVRESPDLQRLLRSPAFTEDEQKNAIGAILHRAGIFTRYGGDAANRYVPAGHYFFRSSSPSGPCGVPAGRPGLYRSAA